MNREPVDEYMEGVLNSLQESSKILNVQSNASGNADFIAVGMKYNPNRDALEMPEEILNLTAGDTWVITRICGFEREERRIEIHLQPNWKVIE